MLSGVRTDYQGVHRVRWWPPGRGAAPSQQLGASVPWPGALVTGGTLGGHPSPLGPSSAPGPVRGALIGGGPVRVPGRGGYHRGAIGSAHRLGLSADVCTGLGVFGPWAFGHAGQRFRPDRARSKGGRSVDMYGSRESRAGSIPGPSKRCKCLFGSVAGRGGGPGARAVEGEGGRRPARRDR